MHPMFSVLFFNMSPVSNNLFSTSFPAFLLCIPNFFCVATPSLHHLLLNNGVRCQQESAVKKKKHIELTEALGRRWEEINYALWVTGLCFLNQELQSVRKHPRLSLSHVTTSHFISLALIWSRLSCSIRSSPTPPCQYQCFFHHHALWSKFKVLDP